MALKPIFVLYNAKSIEEKAKTQQPSSSGHTHAKSQSTPQATPKKK